MKIRKATLKDIPQIAKLIRQMFDTHNYMDEFWLPKWTPKKVSSFQELLNYKKIDEYFIKEAEEEIKDKKVSLFVAEINKEIVGYISFLEKKNDGWFRVKKYGYIEQVCIDKNHRGQGIAKELIEFTENYFRKKKIHHILLDTAIENIVAQTAWENLGYKKLKYLHLKKI